MQDDVTSTHILFGFTVGENIIDTPKMRNNYGSIQLFIFILFSINPCKIIALIIFCLIFGISSLLLFLSALPKVTTIAIVKSESKKISQYRKEPMNKSTKRIQKMEQRG